MSLVRKFAVTNLKQAGLDVLGATVGFVGAYQITKILKKNTLPINAGIALAGTAIAVFCPNQFAQFLGAGIAVYGGIKAINNLTTISTPITDTKGVDGILPEGVRDVLAKSFPSLGDVEDFGSANDTRLDEPATEVRAINGFNNFMSGAELEMSGTEQLLMMS